MMLAAAAAEVQRDREGLWSAAHAEGEDPGVIAAGHRRQRLGVAQPRLAELRAEMLEQRLGRLGHQVFRSSRHSHSWVTEAARWTGLMALAGGRRGSC